MRTPLLTRRVRFVLKIDVPILLEGRITQALRELVKRLPVENGCTLTRGEYLCDERGVPTAPRLSKRRKVRL